LCDKKFARTIVLYNTDEIARLRCQVSSSTNDDNVIRRVMTRICKTVLLFRMLYIYYLPT